MAIVQFPASDVRVEIWVGECIAAPHAAGRRFHVSVNETGDEDGVGDIHWDGTSYAEARKVACEKQEEFGGKIVDMVSADDFATVNAFLRARSRELKDCPF